MAAVLAPILEVEELRLPVRVEEREWRGGRVRVLVPCEESALSVPVSPRRVAAALGGRWILRLPRIVEVGGEKYVWDIHVGAWVHERDLPKVYRIIVEERGKRAPYARALKEFLESLSRS